MRDMKKAPLITLCLLILMVSSCTFFKQPPAVTPPPVLPPIPKEMPPLVAIGGGDIPDFRDDLDRESLARAVQKSLE